MPKPAKLWLVGALSIINIALIVIMAIFVANDYMHTVAARNALVPDSTEIVSDEQLGPGQSILETIE